MIKLLEQAFDVRPHERRLVWLFFACFLSVGMIYTIGATVGDTLFLSHLAHDQVARRLPYVYLGIAVANVLSAIVFAAVQSRVSRTISIVGTQVVLAATVLLARQLVEADTGVVYFGLVIWLEAVALTSVTLCFSFAGDYFNARDARRLFGFISGGMALGTVLGGYSIQLFVALLGTKNLLFVASGILLSNAALTAVIFRVGKPLPADALEGAATQDAELSLTALLSRPYVRLLLLVVPLTVVTYVTVDYQMKWIASSKSEVELALFFGSFFGWVGVAQVVFQFGIAQRLLMRFGIINCLMIVPVTLGAASIALYTGSFFEFYGLGILVLSAGVNFLRMTLSETLDLPSRELLFLPLPSRVRQRLQPLLSGAWAPAAQGIGAAIMLLALQFDVAVESLSLVALFCTCGLLLALVRLRPRYRQTLADTLGETQLDATDLEGILQSPGADELIAGLLRSSNRGVVKATIGLLGGHKLGSIGPLLETLVESDDSEIAVAALERLTAAKDARLMTAIAHGWSSPHAAVRQAAVLALCEASGEAALSQLAEALHSDDAALRSSAVIGLARHCGEAGQSLVMPGIAERAHDADPAERAEAARVIARIGGTGYSELLSTLLRDSTLEVRLTAAEACAAMGDPLLLDALIVGLTEPELRAACIRALGSMPADAVAPIARLVDDASMALSGRCAMARVLGRIGGALAVETLWAHVGGPHPLGLRLAAAESLRLMRGRDALVRFEPRDYDQQIEQICGLCGVLDRALFELRSTDRFALGIFADHARLHIELLCAILALRYDMSAIERVKYNLFSESREVGTRALELFEEMLPRRLAVPVVGAVQAWLETPRGTGAGLTAETTAKLIAAEPWLRIATVHFINEGAAYPTIHAGSLSDADRELYRLLDLVVFLKQAPLLRELSAYFLVEQAEIAQWRVLSEAEVLFAQGDPGDALYIIGQGAIEIRVGGHLVATLGAGECVGDLALLDGESRSAAAIATQETSLLRVPSDRFRNLIMTQQAAARAMLRTLDQRIRSLQTTVQANETVQPFRMRRSQLMRAQKLGLSQLVSTMSFLREVSLFRDLSTPALATIAGIAQEVQLLDGDTLFEEGDPGESLYLVSEGKISVIVEEREVAVLERNACLGEMALISGLPRSATARALGEARLLRIDSDDFNNLLSNEAEIPYALLKTLAQRLRAALRQQART